MDVRARRMWEWMRLLFSVVLLALAARSYTIDAWSLFDYLLVSFFLVIGLTALAEYLAIFIGEEVRRGD